MHCNQLHVDWEFNHNKTHNYQQQNYNDSSTHNQTINTHQTKST